MFKLIMLTNTMESTKILCNSILNQVPYVQISGICTSLEELDSLAEKVKPDIILMKVSDYIQSKFNHKSDIAKFKILFCDISYSGKNSPTKLLIPKNASIEDTSLLIKEFFSKKNTLEIRKEVIKELEAFDFDFKLNGTIYLLETILYCYENKTDYVFENLEKKVYPHIAKMFHTCPKNVKWCIIRAFNLLPSNNNIPSSQKQLSSGSKVDVYEKTTAKQLISLIVTKLN